MLGCANNAANGVGAAVRLATLVQYNTYSRYHYYSPHLTHMTPFSVMINVVNDILRVLQRMMSRVRPETHNTGDKKRVTLITIVRLLFCTAFACLECAPNCGAGTGADMVVTPGRLELGAPVSMERLNHILPRKPGDRSSACLQRNLRTRET